MPDIAMCSTNECPIRRCCYRSMAVPDMYQSITKFYNKEKDVCDYFMELHPNDKLANKPYGDRYE